MLAFLQRCGRKDRINIKGIVVEKYNVILRRFRSRVLLYLQVWRVFESCLGQVVDFEVGFVDSDLRSFFKFSKI